MTDDWNTVHLIVRGNMLTHVINEQLMSVVIDDDAPNRPIDGLIGVQVHVWPAHEGRVPEYPAEELVDGSCVCIL